MIRSFRRTAIVLLGAASLAVLMVPAPPSTAAASPEQATATVDRCGDARDARQDMRSASVSWTAASFAVQVTACGGPALPAGDWLLSVHLTGPQPELQVQGTYQDLGSYTRFSGLRLCRAEQCAYSPGVEDFLAPPGRPLDGGTHEGLPTAAGYAGWTDALPPAVAPPTALQWWAEVRPRDASGAFSSVIDRLPDTGSVPVTQEPGVPTRIRMVNFGAPAVWSPTGSTRADVGTLRTAEGAPVVGRRVRVLGAAADDPLGPSGTSSSGLFRASYSVRRNSVVQVAFGGDGVHDVARSATYTALVRAAVTLDAGGVQGLVVPAHRPVVLRGVVRPRASGTVQVLVRPARGGAWRLLRTVPLQQGRYDSWYRTTWSPLVPGTYALRTVWGGGTSRPGGLVNGISETRYVDVRR